MVRNISNRKYCLICSPFGLHNTKKLHDRDNDKRKYVNKVWLKDTYRCGICLTTNKDEFYPRIRARCKHCHNHENKKRMVKNRLYATSKLGGKCLNCGFDKYHAALEIHHTDPTIKDSKFRNLRVWTKSKIDEELKSCILLCANCHRGYHAGLLNLKNALKV